MLVEDAKWPLGEFQAKTTLRPLETQQCNSQLSGHKASNDSVSGLRLLMKTADFQEVVAMLQDPELQTRNPKH